MPSMRTLMQKEKLTHFDTFVDFFLVLYMFFCNDKVENGIDKQWAKILVGL